MDTVEKDCAKKCFRKEARTNLKKINKTNDVVGVEESSSRRQCANQQSNGHHHAGFKPQILKPRISKLENLEAKMASIEVSLSSNNNNSNTEAVPVTCQRMAQQYYSNYRHQSNAVYFTANTINNSGRSAASNNQSATTTSAKVCPTTTDISCLMDEIDQLRDRLSEKDAIISSLREQTNHVVTTSSQTTAVSQTTTTACNQYVNLNCAWVADSISTECPLKEERTECIQRQIDNKSIIVKNLKIKLEGLEVKDLDSRIRQAELECLLEKEEMKILNLKQELMNIKAANLNQKSNGIGNRFPPALSNGNELTLYSVVVNCNSTSLFAFDVSYDNCAPCFYVTTHHVGKGLIVQWSKENSKLKKGDRILELNGQTVVNCSKVEFIDMLKSSIAIQLKMVILRNTATLTARKANGKEMETLKEEMSSLVNKLDNKIKENRELLISSQHLRKEIGRLKNDNQRLHHRTFYLEDHVNELMASHQTASKLPIGNGGHHAINDGSEEDTQEAIVPSLQIDKASDTVPRSSKVSFSATNSVCCSSNVHQTTTNRLFKGSNAIMKTEHANNAVQVWSRSNISPERHVLQVKIPFSNIDHTTPHDPLGNCPIRPYMNVPIGHHSSAGHNNKEALARLQWLHGRCAGADSDSGNYSGDSMDDTHHHAAVPALMTGFILQRQTPQQQPNAVTVTALNSNCETRVGHHCYMNVQPNRKTVAAIKDSEDKAKIGSLELINASDNKSVRSLQGTPPKKPGRLPMMSSKSTGFIRLMADESKDGNELEAEEWC